MDMGNKNNTEYINGFSCAVKEDHSEVVLVVFRNYPKINEDYSLGDNECDVVNTLIMTSETAVNLRNALDKVLNDDDSLDEPTENDE